MTKTVFLVDDDHGMLTVCSIALGLAGFSVRTFASGQDALLALSGEAQPDVMVLDLRMPGMDGVALLHAAQALGFSKPVLFLTAAAEAADKLLGDLPHLPKPFEPDELIEVVGKLVT